MKRLNKRDDFSESVKRILQERVGNHCSNPECRKATSGPHSDPGKVVRLGVAAHITAAAPKGPRHNDSLSQKERGGIENGIWLCQKCAKLIDADPDKYPISKLLEWKQIAEKKAEETKKRCQTKIIIADSGSCSNCSR